MIAVGIGKLEKSKQKYAECREQLDAWLAEARFAKWHSFNDIKQKYPTASNIGNKIVIFNIKGNKYRLETKIYYERETVIIKRFGSHAEYNKWYKKG
ncbi:type II toxin-antitoxin system HigB family toxin [bacterium]|nr:type II toxin-antitoxin system HigB family toxin [bacterium]